MRIWILSGLFISLSAPSGLPAQDAAAEPAVRELVAKYATARGSEDAGAVAALFTVDADQLVSTGEWRRGREELVRGMIESSRRNAGARTITVEAVRFPVPGLAIADARYEIAASPGTEARKMWSTFICVREAGGWRIAAIRNMLPSR